MGSYKWISTQILHAVRCPVKCITGESLDCPDYTQFMEEVLTPLLMQFEPQDVYNADETSLYYKCLPDRTYAFEHERVLCILNLVQFLLVELLTVALL